MDDSESDGGYSSDSDFDAASCRHRPSVAAATTATRAEREDAAVCDELLPAVPAGGAVRRRPERRNNTTVSRRDAAAEDAPRRLAVREESEDDGADGARANEKRVAAAAGTNGIERRRSRRGRGGTSRGASGSATEGGAAPVVPKPRRGADHGAAGGRSGGTGAERTDESTARTARETVRTYARTRTTATSAAASAVRSSAPPPPPPPPERSKRVRKLKLPSRRLERLARPRSYTDSSLRRRGGTNTNVRPNAAPSKKKTAVSESVRRFVERQERMEYERKERKERREMELKYDMLPAADRKRCTSCGNAQTFEELYGGRVACPNCSNEDGGGGTYETASKFCIKRFEKRLKDFQVKRETTIIQILKQRITDVQNASVGFGRKCHDGDHVGERGNESHSGRRQSWLSKKMSERRTDFLSRVGDDIRDRSRRIADLERKIEDAEAKRCPFRPLVSAESSLKASKRNPMPLYLPKRYDRVGVTRGSTSGSFTGNIGGTRKKKRRGKKR